jgi:hypothetical protein
MTRLRSLLTLGLGTALLVASGSALAGKSKKIAAKTISPHLVMLDSGPLVPLADLATAAGCELHLDPKTQAYEAWPCKPGALLAIDVPALARHAKSSQAETQGFDPQPDPPIELRMDGKLLSKRVILEGGDPHVPLAEVARLMGGKVKGKGKGKTAWIVVPPAADAPLQLRAP